MHITHTHLPRDLRSFNGWGVTMVDALDTMYLMGLHDEFERGIKLVEKMSFSGENVRIN